MIMARLQRTADNNIRAASAARATASATVNAAATGLVDLTTTEDTNVGRDKDEGRKQQHPTITKDRLLSEGLEYVGFNRQRQKMSSIKRILTGSKLVMASNQQH